MRPVPVAIVAVLRRCTANGNEMAGGKGSSSTMTMGSGRHDELAGAMTWLTDGFGYRSSNGPAQASCQARIWTCLQCRVTGLLVESVRLHL
jgi:hypothetical protein